ncbi:hypothetical protein ACA910_001849 [Epithemia clementina (nom. ined.)]
MDNNSDGEEASLAFLSSTNHAISITTCAIQQQPQKGSSSEYKDDDDDDNDDENNRVVLWMGRSDGSLVAVKWSDTEPWARFMTQLVPCKTKTNQFTVKASLVKQQKTAIALPENDNEQQPPEKADTNRSDEEDDDDDDDVFRLVAQVLQVEPKSPVQHLLPLSSFLFEDASRSSSDDDDSLVALSSTATDKGDIYAWRSSSSSRSSTNHQEPVFLQLADTWTGVHTQPLVALAPIQRPGAGTVVCSVSRDGTVALWDVTTTTTTNDTRDSGLLAQVQLQSPALEVEHDPDGDAIITQLSSAHVTSDYLYVGTTHGRVLVYDWSALSLPTKTAKSTTTTTPTFDQTTNTTHGVLFPVGSWMVSKDNAAVTALTRIVVPNHPSGRAPSRSTFLATGNARGMVKQWQLLERRRSTDRSSSSNSSSGLELVVVVEAWPKLANQGLPGGRAHVFPHQPPNVSPSSNDPAAATTAIVDLHFVETTKEKSASSNTLGENPPSLQRPTRGRASTTTATTTTPGLLLLSASQDCVHCWDANTGRKSHTLHGFEQLHNLCPVPAPRAAFVTNGMKNVVCIHDYSSSSTTATLKNDGDDDDDFDVGKYHLDLDE